MNLNHWVDGVWADGSWVPESWGVAEASATPAASVTTGGGYVHGERHRSRKEISEARKRLGLEDAYEQELAAAIIADVAARQAKALELDEQKRFEEITRQFALERIEFRAAHLEALNLERERLINLEIAKLLRKKFDDDEGLLMLLMVAAATA